MSGDFLRALNSEAVGAAGDAWELRFKRGTDVCFALAFMLFFAPLLLLISMAIMLEDGGSPLFVQERTGLGQRRFFVYKFRTMKRGADSGRGRPPIAVQPQPTVAQAVRGD